MGRVTDLEEMRTCLVVLLAMVAPAMCGCPKMPPHPGFDPFKFTADWHVTRMKRLTEGGGIRCVHIQIFEDPGDHVLHGNWTGLEDNGMMWNNEGKLNIKDPAFPGRMTLTTDEWEADVTILSTDYDDFAVYFVCSETPDGDAMMGMGIMGRNHLLPKKQVDALLKILSDLDLDVGTIMDSTCN